MSLKPISLWKRVRSVQKQYAGNAQCEHRQEEGRYCSCSDYFRSFSFHFIFHTPILHTSLNHEAFKKRMQQLLHPLSQYLFNQGEDL